MEQAALQGVDRAVTFSLSVEDYVQAGQLSMLNAYRRPSYVVWLLLGVVGGLVIAGALIGDFREHLFFIAAILVLSLCSILLIPYFISIPVSFRRNFARHKAFQYLMTFTWSEQDLAILAHNSTSRVEWGDMVGFAENRYVMLFYPAPRLMHMLPKRVLSSRQVEDLRACSAAICRSS